MRDSLEDDGGWDEGEEDEAMNIEKPRNLSVSTSYQDEEIDIDKGKITEIEPFKDKFNIAALWPTISINGYVMNVSTKLSCKLFRKN